MPSFERMAKVLTEPNLDLRANERLVALVLLSFADRKTMRCWPSIDTIAARAKIKRQTACQAIKKLEELRLILVTKVSTGAGRYPRNEYSLTPIIPNARPVPARFRKGQD